MEYFDKIIEELAKDNVTAMFFDKEGNLVAGKKKIDSIAVDIYDLISVFFKEIEDSSKEVILRGKKKIIYISPYKGYIFVAIGNKEDENLIRGYSLMLK